MAYVPANSYHTHGTRIAVEREVTDVCLCQCLKIRCAHRTREQQEQLLELITNPPQGSKIAAAKEFGIDLTLNLGRLALTPTERAQEMEGALELVEEIQRAAEKLRS
jgi:hypothetical protein